MEPVGKLCPGCRAAGRLYGFGQKMESDGTSAGRSSESQLGSKTREAIQKVQQKAKLQPDGYPDYQLLNKINKYNPDIGFAVPVQPRKLHRRK